MPLHLRGTAFAKARELAAQARLMGTAHADSTVECIDPLTTDADNVPIEHLA